MKKIIGIILIVCNHLATAQEPSFVANVTNRPSIDLNGKWQYIIDPYETGFYNYRWRERVAGDREAYWNSDVPDDKTDRKEHGYTDNYSLNVPGDWNSQDDRLLYYEGTIWYRRVFDVNGSLKKKKLLLYFGAVNYHCHVYLNGIKLGEHKGGFTPFFLEVADSVIQAENNNLVVKVDNRRYADEVPTLNTDWWNYGGITRDVKLLILPENYISNYNLQLSKEGSAKSKRLTGWIKFKTAISEHVQIEIPELKVKKSFSVRGDSVSFSFDVNHLQLWSPENPKLYSVLIRSSAEEVKDVIGFRTIEVRGSRLLLNGEPVFLRGICTHEEIPAEKRRAFSKEDDILLLKQAKELNANMVRLAHYPHNEQMARVADSLGLLLWSEIPVYWTIRFSNLDVLVNAKRQLKDMIIRDSNRASIIIWSVGNETPVSPERTEFMKTLAQFVKKLDPSRMVSAALEYHQEGNRMVVNDPLGEYTDIISVNEYLGWYGKSLPSACRDVTWDVRYPKPFFISETGAEALGNYHADSLTRWSEEYQEWYYREQVQMMKRMPDNFVGLAPWVLNDFRSPKRNNPTFQGGWNNKGLFDQQGRKKKAFYVLKGYYDEIAARKVSAEKR